MSVESILRALAEQSGRAGRARGAVIGNTISNLSQAPGQIMDDRRQLAERQRAEAIRNEQLGLQRNADVRAGAADTRAQHDQDAQDAAGAAAIKRQDALRAGIAAGFGGKSDPKDFDEPAAIKAVTDAGFPDLAPTIVETHRKFQPEKPKLTPNVDTTKSVIDETGKVVIAGVPEAPKPDKVIYGQPITAMVGGRRTLVRMGSDGNAYDVKGGKIDSATIEPEPKEPKAAKDERLVQVQGPDGSTIWVRESDAVGRKAAQTPRGVTGAERGVLAFYNRGKEAVAVLTEGGENSLENKMAKQGVIGQQRLGYEGIGSNLIKNEDQQRYRNAQRSFTEARLRKESGAAIPDSEFENDRKTYFVQPFDDKKTVEQKAKLRQGVLDGLKFASGRAYEEFYGEPNESPAKSGGGAVSGATTTQRVRQNGITYNVTRDASGKVISSEVAR